MAPFLRLSSMYLIRFSLYEVLGSVWRAASGVLGDGEQPDSRFRDRSRCPRNCRDKPAAAPARGGRSLPARGARDVHHPPPDGAREAVVVADERDEGEAKHGAGLHHGSAITRNGRFPGQA